MKVIDFINQIPNSEINSDIIKNIEEKYNIALNGFLRRLVSQTSKTIFFEGNIITRLLSIDEILDAPEDLHQDFIGKGYLPLFEIGDNDFIVYVNTKSNYAIYNIVDECLFNDTANIEELF